MPFMSRQEIKEVGFASVGENVLISTKASFYGATKIHIGNHVRIDDFCVISAGEEGVFIGNYIHIAVFSSLIGKGKISLGNFTNISSRVSIYSSSDDFSGNFMTNPMVSELYTNVISGSVDIEEHVVIGSGSIILPNVKISVGAAIGALSLVKKDCEEFSIYGGVPAKKINERNRTLIECEKKLLSASHGR